MSTRLDLEKQRRLRGVSLQTLAVYCGCSRQFIHLLLQGKRNSQAKLKELHRFFEGEMNAKD